MPLVAVLGACSVLAHHRRHRGRAAVQSGAALGDRAAAGGRFLLLQFERAAPLPSSALGWAAVAALLIGIQDQGTAVHRGRCDAGAGGRARLYHRTREGQHHEVCAGRRCWGAYLGAAKMSVPFGAHLDTAAIHWEGWCSRGSRSPTTPSGEADRWFLAQPPPLMLFWHLGLVLPATRSPPAWRSAAGSPAPRPTLRARAIPRPRARRPSRPGCHCGSSPAGASFLVGNAHIAFADERIGLGGAAGPGNGDQRPAAAATGAR